MAQDPEPGTRYHEPVMAEEVVALLSEMRNGIVVDATFGGGGHSKRLMESMSGATLMAVDRDPAARANGKAIGVEVLAGNFADLAEILESAGVESVAGVLFDFGVSSRQLDDGDRGFSYRHDGPLDMRMDPDSSGPTAADLVNTLDARDLARIIRVYGEDQQAGRIARAIVSSRPIDSTKRLAEVVAGAVPAAVRRKGHPARKTFQALRMEVNGELDAIEQGVEDALRLLAVNGRVVAISYHSLEDRLIKRRFATAIAGCTCPPGLPICGCGAQVRFRLLTPKPMRPGPDEITRNPRSRSARLRAIERIAA